MNKELNQLINDIELKGEYKIFSNKKDGFNTRYTLYNTKLNIVFEENISSQLLLRKLRRL